MEIAVQIVRFVDDHQPGWAECELLDADLHKHSFVDKIPGFSLELLDANSTYPRPGRIACEVVARWKDVHGRDLARVTTARPRSIESTDGLSEFIVFAAQLLTS